MGMMNTIMKWIVALEYSDTSFIYLLLASRYHKHNRLQNNNV